MGHHPVKHCVAGKRVDFRNLPFFIKCLKSHLLPVFGFAFIRIIAHPLFSLDIGAFCFDSLRFDSLRTKKAFCLTTDGELFGFEFYGFA